MGLCRLDLFSLGLGKEARRCGHDFEPSGCIKCGEFLRYVRTC
jgi:hypothetical protein